MSSSGDGESARAGERVYLHIYDYETKEFSGLTTYHGLVRIYNSNTWPSRIFWCVVVLSCLSLFMIHSGYLLLGYHSKPTLFQVKTIVVSDGMSFPDITLCNHNPLKMSRLSDYNMSKTVQSYLLSFLDDHVERDDLEEKHRAFEEYEHNYRLQNKRNFSTADFFFHVRPTCDDLVLSCSFAGEDIENCCANSEVALTDVGYCIRFPYSMLKRKQYMSGRGYGWQFILDRSSDSALDSPIFSDTGFYLVVQEPEKEVSVKSKGLSVPPGATLHAGISYRNVSHLQRSEWGFCQQKWSPELHGSTPTGMKASLAEELAHVNGSHTRKRHSRRISVVPLHIHMDKRGSNNPSFRDTPVHSQEAAAHRNVFSSRKSLVSSAFDRSGSTMDGAISSLLPKFQHHRKSIAVGALGRRGSHLEGAGEILITRQGSMAVMPHAHRRSSSVAVTTGPSNRRPSVQPSDDTLHLIVNHRRPSAHPKHFLI